MTKFFLIAASMLSAATSPALARDAKPADTSPVETSQPAAVTPAPAVRETRYCIVETVTGSRIPHKTCKTRGAWIQDDGFDPLAK